jgi:hypothetical protein
MSPLTTELAQPGVPDPEVVAHLVDDGPSDLLDDLGVGGAHRADGLPVDRDPVGQGAGVVPRTAGQGHSLVEPEQTRGARVVLHRDGARRARRSVKTDAGIRPA